MNQNNSSITLTSSASKRIMSVLSKDNSAQFRVYVTGGGCSGFQYGFKFDDDEAFDDDVIDFGSFKVFLESFLVILCQQLQLRQFTTMQNYDWCQSRPGARALEHSSAHAII